jgi:hypothetical protein
MVGKMPDINRDTEWESVFEATLQQYLQETREQLEYAKTVELQPGCKCKIVATSRYISAVHELVLQAQTIGADYLPTYLMVSTRHHLPAINPWLHGRWRDMLTRA